MHIELLELKERLQSDVLHPSDPLTEVVDDWVVSVKNKKPLVERICKKIVFLYFLYKIIKYEICTHFVVCWYRIHL